MAMNISKLTQFLDKNDDDIIYASSSRRAFASVIDSLIVLIVRLIAVQLITVIYLQEMWKDFFEEFYEKFGTQSIKRVPEHLNYLTNHPVFMVSLLSLIFVILLGAVYHAYFNSSSKQGTIGKQLLKIKIVTAADHRKISFGLGLSHYFLSVAPFLYVLYILQFQLSHKLSFFDAIANNSFNFVLGLVFLAWIHLHLMTKKKTTAYDLICSTILLRK